MSKQRDTEKIDTEKIDTEKTASSPEAGGTMKETMMKETMMEKARRTVAELLARAGWDQETDYAAAFALLTQETFCGSEPSDERYILDGANPIDQALDAHAETAAPFHEAVKESNRLGDLCRNENGHIPIHQDKTGRWRTNPILDHYEERMREAEERYWLTREVLADLLTVEVMASIREALRLAGVTDAPTVDEVTRCVVRGGAMFDGRNVAHAERWRAERAQREAAAEAQREAEGAATERLLVLMTAHGMGQWAAGFREDMGDEDARTRFLTANLSAAVHCTGPSARRSTAPAPLCGARASPGRRCSPPSWGRRRQRRRAGL